MNQHVSALTASKLGVSPLTPTIGAVITGLDLARPLDGGEQTALRAALLDWKVLFFRDQPITTEQHLVFARRFGEARLEGGAELVSIASGLAYMGAATDLDHWTMRA